MEKFVIEGGAPLSGTVLPAGNKNAALPILAACVLTEDEVVLGNVRGSATWSDARSAARPGRTPWTGAGPTRSRRARASVDRTAVDRDHAGFIRASFLVAGPLLARFGTALMPPPAVDVIGRRRLDPHMDAFTGARRRLQVSSGTSRSRRRTVGSGGRRVHGRPS